MIKAYFDTEAVSIRLGLVFSRFGVSPNLWTVLALVPAVLGFTALYEKNLFLGLVFFFISGFIDMIDGAVARVTKSVSSLGAFLDGVIDRYVEMALYVGLMFYLWDEKLVFPSQLWIILLVYGALMPTFVRAYADHRGVVTDPEKHRRMGGLIERFERLTLLYVGMLLGLRDVRLLMLMVAVTAVLSNYTALQRIYYVVKEAK
jgi:phosphatidylglycerophosphate synthase